MCRAVVFQSVWREYICRPLLKVRVDSLELVLEAE